MVFKKMFLIGACMLILAAIGVNIFLYQKVVELSGKPALNEVTKEERVSLPVHDPGNHSSVKEVHSNRSEINRLKSYLESAEEELNMVNEQIAEVTEEISRSENPEGIKKALQENAIRLNIDKDYAQLFERLNLSQKDLAEFKSLEYEFRVASKVSEPWAPETWKELTTLRAEMKEKYKPDFVALLGKEKYKVYESFRESIQERNAVNDYLAEIDPENKMSDDLAEKLINGMYEARITVNKKLDIFGENSPDSWRDIFDALILTHKKYEEAANKILPYDQAELFNSKRKWILEEYERTKELYVGIEEPQNE